MTNISKEDVLYEWYKKEVLFGSSIEKSMKAIVKLVSGFTEWFMSDENPYGTIYHSDDDNDGKWYDYYSEGINRHYFTTEQLFQSYLNTLIQ